MRIPSLTVFLALSLIVMLAGCSGSSEPSSRRELEREFKAEYGFSPASQVTDLRCKTVWIGDTWSKWMLFTYDQTTVDQITSSGFTNASAEDLKKPWEAIWSQDVTALRPNPNAPKWFRLPGDRSVRIYYKLGHPNDYAGYRYIWIDDTNKTVYGKSAAWH